jgi:tol-pal system protein YbgF
MRTMMRNKCPTAARAITAMAAVIVLGGCATKSDVRDLQDQLTALTASQDSLITELRIATRLTQDTLRTQSGQMFDLRGDVTSLLRDIQRQMGELRALTGENQRGIMSMRDQVANMRGGGAAGPAGPGGGGAAGEAMAGVDQNADQLWSVATGQLSRGSLTTAQRAFEQFLRDHPNDPRAPDAHFFLADILAQQDRPDEAMRAFAEIQELFPSSPKVADALYRIAVLQIEAGDVDQARETLQRIINTYPESAIASIARDKLEEIG